VQLKEYLSFLLEKGLIDEFPQGKGLRLLQISKEIESLVGLLVQLFVPFPFPLSR
jgi:hypothetical protein